MKREFLPDPAKSLEISCEAVAAWVNCSAEERPRLIDCREPDEWDYCRIKGAELVPLADFPQKSAVLAASSPQGVVVYCHHGMRSLHAARFLRAQGLAYAFSMNGGVDAWSREIDPDVPRY